PGGAGRHRETAAVTCSGGRGRRRDLRRPFPALPPLLDFPVHPTRRGAGPAAFRQRESAAGCRHTPSERHPMREEAAGGRSPGGAEEQLALLADSVDDCALFLLDAGGRVAAWNAGARRLFGYEEGEVLGRPFGQFFTAEDRDRGDPEKELAEAAAA